MGRTGWQVVAVAGAVVAGVLIGGAWHYEHAHTRCPAERRVVTADDAGHQGYGCFPAAAPRPFRFGYTWFYD